MWKIKHTRFPAVSPSKDWWIKSRGLNLTEEPEKIKRKWGFIWGWEHLIDSSWTLPYCCYLCGFLMNYWPHVRWTSLWLFMLSAVRFLFYGYWLYSTLSSFFLFFFFSSSALCIVIAFSVGQLNCGFQCWVKLPISNFRFEPTKAFVVDCLNLI